MISGEIGCIPKSGFGTTDMLYNSTPPLTTSPREIRGDFLARIRRSPRARAWLGAALVDQKVVLIEPTLGQAALLCHASATSIKRARNGHNSYNGNHKPVDVVLERAWHKATPEQQVAFVKIIGAESIWSVLVAAL